MVDPVLQADTIEDMRSQQPTCGSRRILRQIGERHAVVCQHGMVLSGILAMTASSVGGRTVSFRALGPIAASSVSVRRRHCRTVGGLIPYRAARALHDACAALGSARMHGVVRVHP